jgi:hypothetical protein
MANDNNIRIDIGNDWSTQVRVTNNIKAYDIDNYGIKIKEMIMT